MGWQFVWNSTIKFLIGHDRPEEIEPMTFKLIVFYAIFQGMMLIIFSFNYVLNVYVHI